MARYHDVRDEIRDGDLILVRGRSWLAWLIRLRTSSPFAHCGLAMWVAVGGERRLCVFEAMEGIGVQLIPLSTVLARDGAFSWYGTWSDITTTGTSDSHGCRVQKIDHKQIVAFALQHWGKRYASPWQFVRSFSCLIRRCADWMGFPIDTDPERFYCAEYVIGGMTRAGWWSSQYLDPAETTPGDVARMACFYPKGEVTS